MQEVKEIKQIFRLILWTINACYSKENKLFIILKYSKLKFELNWSHPQGKWIRIGIGITVRGIYWIIITEVMHYGKLTLKQFFLKGSYDAISSFPFSLECYKLFVHR